MNRLAERFPIVGVGASAGGVQALQRLFESLPEAVDAAFVVVVHLDPGHQSELPTILAARSEMKVKVIQSLAGSGSSRGVSMSLSGGTVWDGTRPTRALLTSSMVAVRNHESCLVLPSSTVRQIDV